jgi:hypothetical protein
MSRENWKKKIHLRLFVKSGALQFGIRVVCFEDPRFDLCIEIKHERAIGIQRYFWFVYMYLLSKI